MISSTLSVESVTGGGIFIIMEIIRRSDESGNIGGLMESSFDSPWYFNLFSRYSLYTSRSASKYRLYRWVDEDTVIDPDTGRVNIAGMLGPEHSGQGPGSRDGSFGLSEFGLSEFDINELQAARLYLRYRNNNIKRPNIFQRIYQFIRNLFKK